MSEIIKNTDSTGVFTAAGKKTVPIAMRYIANFVAHSSVTTFTSY